VKEELKMKTQSKPTLILAILAVAFGLSACGKTNRSVSGMTSEGAGVVTIPNGTDGGIVTIPPPTYTSTSTSTSTSTYTSSAPPLSYEFTLKGNQAAQTPNITTDNILKVKFRVTAEQGNNVWKASELKVTLAMNGTEVTPQYTSSNYTYGMVGETSNVIDLSSYVTPGVPVKITVKNPANDFYCTYWGGYYYQTNVYGPAWIQQNVNPLYNLYPGCRKAVNAVHNWSGVLTVQTSSTQAI
jgi:hypothetical protein